MARRFATPIDLQQLELLRAVLENRTGNPSTGKEGQVYYNTTTDKVMVCTVTGSPGTWTPLLFGPVTTADILDGTITDVDVNAANKDGLAAVPSLRTLGSGAQQAAAGNDPRFTDSRPPTAHAATHQPGGSDPMAVDAAVGTGSLRTLGSGAQQAMPGNRTLDAINAPVAPVAMNGQKIVGLADPTATQDAANKQYVDNLVQGIDPKASVKAATTANVTLAGGAPSTLDGVALAANDRVLVKDQTTASQNGIYTVQTLGTGANGTWIRATDMDSWLEVPGAFTFVEQGTTQADTGWVSTADQGGTLGTTNITWSQFSGAGQIIAGAGLTKTGNTLDVGAGTGISVAADTVGLIVPVSVANGGTGSTTAGGARTNLGTPGYYSNNAVHTAATPILIPAATHGLGAGRTKTVQVIEEATGDVIEADMNVAANGDVSIGLAAAPAANTYRVNIVGW